MVIAGAVMFFGSAFVYNLTNKWLQSVPMLAQSIKYLGIVLFTFGIFLEGSYSADTAWRARVSVVEAKVAVAELAASHANIQLENLQRVHRDEIAQANATLQAQIRKQQPTINASCKLNRVAVDLYNNAVTGGTK